MKQILVALLLTVVAAMPAAAQSTAPQGTAPRSPTQTLQAPGQEQEPPAPPPASYLIGPQDVLKISVVDEGPEMQNQLAVVGEDGLISFWTLKSIPAGGKTVREIQDRIAGMLADGFIKNPTVRVEVDKYKSQYVTILGEVRTQARVAMQGTKSLLEALAEAGGQTNQASNDVEVSHTDGKKEMIDLRDYQAAQVFMLRDGDVVLVQKAQQFYINGEVRNNGALLWQRNMTLAQAVTLAGGLTDRGTYRNAEATRIVNGKREVVKLKEMSPILPDDIIKIGKKIF